MCHIPVHHTCRKGQIIAEDYQALPLRIGQLLLKVNITNVLQQELQLNKSLL